MTCTECLSFVGRCLKGKPNKIARDDACSEATLKPRSYSAQRGSAENVER